MHSKHLLRALVAVGLAANLTACTGSSCDDLPALTAERDAARDAYAELIASGAATTQQTEEGDARTHALDRRVYDLEQSCQR